MTATSQGVGRAADTITRSLETTTITTAVPTTADTGKARRPGGGDFKMAVVKPLEERERSSSIAHRLEHLTFWTQMK